MIHGEGTGLEQRAAIASILRRVAALVLSATKREVSDMDLRPVVESLRRKRPVFHSEADFQFALAWEIQRAYPAADIRLEYPPANEPNKYLDILVRIGGFSYPVELKYKSKRLSVIVGGEQFSLKNHGAQDLGTYDFVKDICRVESFAEHLDCFKAGYALWLTNDPYYWTAPTNPSAGYVAFSVHDGARKSGVMSWGGRVGAGTVRGREEQLSLSREYEIHWREYSSLGVPNGALKYALVRVE